jgi:hypothetical protein
MITLPPQIRAREALQGPQPGMLFSASKPQAAFPDTRTDAGMGQSQSP